MYVTRSESTSSGIGTLGVLQLIFLVLKLCNLIDWEWWVVLLPTIISVVLFAIVLIVLLVVEAWQEIH